MNSYEKYNDNLTVYFEDPFWVGVFERLSEGKMSVCKVTFGAEPKDYDLWDFVLRRYHELRFSPDIMVETKHKADNPKRRQRNVRKQLNNTGIGTKSQQALQMQLEQNKLERKAKSREQKMAEAKRMFELKQQRKKEKHRGK